MKLREEREYNWVLFFDKDGRNRAGSDGSHAFTLQPQNIERRIFSQDYHVPKWAVGYLILSGYEFNKLSYDDIEKRYKSRGKKLPIRESSKHTGKDDRKKRICFEEDQNKKLSLYVNGEYICSTTQYKTAKQFKDKIMSDGFVKYAGINSIGSSYLKDIKKIDPTDKIVIKNESLSEDTIKTKDGKWTNKGEEGTHGKFKTKKEADAQRRAIYANGFKGESLKESQTEGYDFSDLEKAVESVLGKYGFKYPHYSLHFIERGRRNIPYLEVEEYKDGFDYRDYVLIKKIFGREVPDGFTIDVIPGRETTDGNLFSIIFEPMGERHYYATGDENYLAGEYRTESLKESDEYKTLAKLSKGLEVISYPYGYAITDGFTNDRLVVRGDTYVLDDGRFRLSDKDKERINSLIRKGILSKNESLKEDLTREEDLYKLTFNRSEDKIADKLLTLNNVDTFFDDVRKFTKNVTSDRAIRSWERLAELRYNYLMRGDYRYDESLREDKVLEEDLIDDMEGKVIKRYSDVYDDKVKQRGWWYFTTHGVQPGSIPSDLHVLEIRDGKNDKGTMGTFVRLDGILNTSELKKFDMKEMTPLNEDSRGDFSYERKLLGRLKDDCDYVLKACLKNGMTVTSSQTHLWAGSVGNQIAKMRELHSIVPNADDIVTEEQIDDYEKKLRDELKKEDIPECLKEDWYHFEFTSGSNPYIAKDDREKKRILRKYKGKVTEVKPNFYRIDDREVKKEVVAESSDKIGSYTVRFNTRFGRILHSYSKSFDSLKQAREYATTFDDDLLWAIVDENNNIVLSGVGKRINRKNRKTESVSRNKGTSLKEAKQWSTKYPQYEYEFDDGVKVVAIDEVEAREKYNDIIENRYNGVRSKDDIDNLAQSLYDSGDFWSFNYFSDEELAMLWALCNIGRAYDDEVYEAIYTLPNPQSIFKKAQGYYNEYSSENKFNEGAVVKKNSTKAPRVGLNESASQDLIDAIIWNYGCSKTEAKKLAKDMDEERKELLIKGWKDQARKSFYESFGDYDFTNYNDYLADNFVGYNDDYVDDLMKVLNKCAKALGTTANKLMFYTDYSEEIMWVADEEATELKTLHDYPSKWVLYQLKSDDIKFVIHSNIGVFKNESDGEKVISLFDKVNNKYQYGESLKESDISRDLDYAREEWNKLQTGIDFDTALEKWNAVSKLAEKGNYTKPVYNKLAWDNMVEMFTNSYVEETPSEEIFDAEDDFMEESLDKLMENYSKQSLKFFSEVNKQFKDMLNK